MNFKEGYIALVSVIVLSSVLLLVTLEMANISYIARFNILRTQEKEESATLARSCLQIALVRLAENPDYQRDANEDIVNVGPDLCRIISIEENSPGNFWIKTRGMKNNAVTNLLSAASLR